MKAWVEFISFLYKLASLSKHLFGIIMMATFSLAWVWLKGGCSKKLVLTLNIQQVSYLVVR